MTRIKPDFDFKLNDVSLKSLNILKRLEVDLPITTQANSFTAQIYNEDAEYNNFFEFHDDIKIYLGYEDTGVVGVFHGRIEKFAKSWTPSGSVITISGRSTWVLMLEQFAIKQYLTTELGAILIDLVANYAPGLTTNNVEDTGITPDIEVIDHDYTNDKVSEYAIKAEFDAWVDFDDDLHFTGSPGTNEVSLIAGENIKEIDFNIDWKKIRNYIRCYGKSVENVQLIKTEEDSTSQGKYGVITKLIKNESLDDSSLVQSIADAALLKEKESEWGGNATVYGDERIQPAKDIQVTVPALSENSLYKVQHVKHTYEPKGSGFTTTVVLVVEEEDTSRFYKELYEKTGKTINYSNSGNYNESYVYKFTDDQDALLTLVNAFTDNSTLKITDLTAVASATLTDSIVGDQNYVNALPFISQKFAGANKFYVSNDGGSSYEQVFHDEEHTFISDSGDKNDFKWKVDLSSRPALEVSSVGTDLIYGIDTDDSTLWSFSVPDVAQEIWGLGFGEAKLWQCENGTGKVYKTDPEDGSSEVEVADKAYTLGGCTYFDSSGRLFLIDRTNDEVVEMNTASGADEFTHALPGAIDDPTGLTFDGTNFWIGDKTDDKIYRMTTASTGDNVAWVSTDSYSFDDITDPYDMAWDGSNLRIVAGGDGKIYRAAFGTGTEQEQTLVPSFTVVGANVQLAQSFEVSYSKDCSSVEFYLRRGTTSEDLTCTLHSDDSNKPGTILKTKVNTGTGIGTSNHWEKFTWSTPQALTAATRYWIVLTSTADYDDYAVYYNNAGGYADGQAAVNLSDEFTEDFTTDTYEDTDNTSADWNTTDEELQIYYQESEDADSTGHEIGYHSGSNFYTAQRIDPSTDTTINGVDFKVFSIDADPSDMYVQIRTDDGNEPSTTVLVENSQDITTTGFKTITLTNTNLTGGVIYWIVWITALQRGGTPEPDNASYNISRSVVTKPIVRVWDMSDASPSWNFSSLGIYFRLLETSYTSTGTSLPVSHGTQLQPITKATLTATDTTPGSSTITYQMATESTWENVTSGVEHTFSSTGNNLKWRAVLTTTDNDDKPFTSNIDVEVKDGATPFWQLNTADFSFKINLDNILYLIDSFTPPGGSPRGLTFRTELGASDVFTFGVYLK